MKLNIINLAIICASIQQYKVASVTTYLPVDEAPCFDCTNDRSEASSGSFETLSGTCSFRDNTSSCLAGPFPSLVVPVAPVSSVISSTISLVLVDRVVRVFCFGVFPVAPLTLIFADSVTDIWYLARRTNLWVTIVEYKIDRT